MAEQWDEHYKSLGQIVVESECESESRVSYTVRAVESLSYFGFLKFRPLIDREESEKECKERKKKRH